LDEGEILEEGEPKETFARPQHARLQQFLARVL
jgi:ABC-type histidine transport system ATPase subunit